MAQVQQCNDSLLCPLTSALINSYVATHEEGHESWGEGNDKGSLGKGTRGRAWLEAEGLLRSHQQHGSHRDEGSEGNWRFHASRCVPHQDSYEARYQGRSEDDVRQKPAKTIVKTFPVAALKKQI